MTRLEKAIQSLNNLEFSEKVAILASLELINTISPLNSDYEQICKKYGSILAIGVNSLLTEDES